jgi:hypothetical protein
MKYLTQEKIDAMRDSFSFVPPHTRDTLINYIENGLPTGSFVQAVLSNDLTEAFGRADHINSQHVGTIVSWLYNFAPSTCWGSDEKVREWYKSFRRSDVA